MSDRTLKIPSDRPEKNEDFSRPLREPHQKVELPPCHQDNQKQRTNDNRSDAAKYKECNEIQSDLKAKDENFIQNQFQESESLNQNLEELPFDHENLEQRPKEDESDSSHNNETPKSQQETYASDDQSFQTQQDEPESQLNQINIGTIEQGEIVQESPITPPILTPKTRFQSGYLKRTLYGIPQNYNSFIYERRFVIIQQLYVFDSQNYLNVIQRLGFVLYLFQQGIPLEFIIQSIQQQPNNFYYLRNLIFVILCKRENSFDLYNIAEIEEKNEDQNQQNEKIYESPQFIQKEKNIKAIEVSQCQDQNLGYEIVNKKNEVQNEEDLQYKEAHGNGSIKVIEGSN